MVPEPAGEGPDVAGQPMADSSSAVRSPGGDREPGETGIRERERAGSRWGGRTAGMGGAIGTTAGV